MAWKKIDDSQTNPDSSYSAYLAQGLTNNVNSYPQVLTRGGGIAWNAQNPPQWASYHTPQGSCFTVNIGQQVTQVVFRFSYSTITAHADADGFQGTLALGHFGGTEYVTVGVLPTNNLFSFFDVTMDFLSPTSGEQSFYFTFQSSKLNSLGIVDVQGGVENQVYLDSHGGPSGYVITQGEKYELLSLSEPGHVVDSTGPSTQEGLYYQINYINTAGAHPADGIASVSPEVNHDPPRMRPFYDATKQGAGTVFELGVFRLSGIAYNVTAANPLNAPPQYAHNSASALAQVINLENQANALFRPDLGVGQGQRFSLGAVLYDDGVTNNFLTSDFIINNEVFANSGLSLQLTFNVIGLQYSTEIELSMNLVGQLSGPVATTQHRISPGFNNNNQAVVGIIARGLQEPTAAAKWGMRDSMSTSEMLSGYRQTFTLSNVVLAPDVYTLILETNKFQSVYVYNWYARFVSGGR